MKMWWLVGCVGLFACQNPPAVPLENQESAVAEKATGQVGKETEEQIRKEAASEKPEAVVPAKSDPECEKSSASGKADLSNAEKDQLLQVYLSVQKRYFETDKGGKDVKISADGELRYKIRFRDLLGNQGELSYLFGKAIVAADDQITLCLDEGNKLLWAGNYKRTDSGFALAL